MPSALKFFALGAGLGIPSEPGSSKVRLIFLLSNRMTSGIHALDEVNEVRKINEIILNKCL